MVGRLADSKGIVSLFEGGIRVPGIFSWPGHIPAGQVIATLCRNGCISHAAPYGCGDPALYQIDGMDIGAVLTEQANTPHEEIYWEMEGQTAIRSGKYKLVLHGSW